jgi:rare lipoprotein A
MANPVGYEAEGKASWYGDDFHGRLTANGEIFSANAITGAHPTLPLPCYVRVTSLETGRSMVVRVNDRGPYLPGRIMDLSYRAAAILGFANQGTGAIDVKYIGPAPLKGDDTRMLLASVNRVTAMEQQATRFAMAEPRPRADDPIADVINLFGYAESGEARADIDSAHAAVDAMATRATALEPWVAAVDDDARAIRLELGTFADPAQADEVALAFARIGAVDEAGVRVPAGDAERLTLTHLKPGVGRNDVMLLARELGLGDLVLY